MKSKRNIEQGTYNGEITYCPVNGWDCPGCTYRHSHTGC